MAFNVRQSAVKFLEGFTRASSKPNLYSNRSQRGMYAGKDVRFGNKTCFSAKKSRRKWLPNVQSKRLWSELLREHIPLKVTTAALRGVDKAGGLDNYLLYTTDDRLRSSQVSAINGRVVEAIEEAGDEDDEGGREGEGEGADAGLHVQGDKAGTMPSMS
ncbi:hypothetical protein JKP88DRAFT_166523 [Tribonema minus]|uniref:Large ribosomal subunit protein bL28m n=1 Tax=Tribonema minus TaxID=303371 RepID=A0A835YSL8_9STRA|nr:hypothetical protein JKP88DRAFT_166523 [Tribonema minus]